MVISSYVSITCRGTVYSIVSANASKELSYKLGSIICLCICSDVLKAYVGNFHCCMEHVEFELTQRCSVLGTLL